MSYVPPKDEEPKGTKETNDSLKVILPSISGAQQEHSPNSDQKQDSDHAKPKEHWYELDLQDRLIVLLTLGIFVVTAATAYIFLRQADLMEAQLEEMRGSGNQIERQIILTQGQLTQSSRQVERLGEEIKQFKRMAEAGEGSNKITRQNAQKALQASINNTRLDERPWVLPIRFEMSSEVEVDKAFTVKIFIGNFGKTPGISLRNSSRLFSWNSEPSVDDLNVVVGPAISVGIIAPGSKELSFITDPMILNSVQFDSYKSGANKIYVHGRMDYLDTFVESLPHWTTVCVVHKFGQPLGEFNICQAGNDTDHEH